MPNVKVSQRTGKKQRGQANRKPARKDGANACRSQPGQRRSRRLPQARPECLGPPADSETAVAPGRPSVFRLKANSAQSDRKCCSLHGSCRGKKWQSLVGTRIRSGRFGGDVVEGRPACGEDTSVSA